jgi:RimJ/RimL family protein N-acetyltransferase
MVTVPTSGYQLTTSRLRLRQWTEADREAFAALNADFEVMRYFPARLTREQSDALVEREQARIAERGWGLWAVEVLAGPSFIGFVGLAKPNFSAHFTPTVEIGWRLAQAFWGVGYATEAAQAVLQFAFDRLELPEVVSFTAKPNQRSIRVMDRLGMNHDPTDDFDHPAIKDGPLRAHVLYRLRRPAGAS